MLQQDRIDPFTRFQVVFEAVGAHESLVQHSTLDADLATLAFYDERERLTHDDHVAGELLLIYHGGEERTLLREAPADGTPTS
jgi:hypothetical protein